MALSIHRVLASAGGKADMILNVLAAADMKSFLIKKADNYNFFKRNVTAVLDMI